MNQREGLTINIQSIKRAESRLQESYLTQASSLPKRRKQKLAYGRSSQQLIHESYDELLRYIDTLDDHVHDIVKTYEVEFLEAYKGHIKKVKYEMQELRQNSLNNANSEKALQEKIDSMQKQLKLFRQQSLKLFDKVLGKEKQLNTANMRIKQLQKQNKLFERTIYNLTKKNKQLQIFYQNNKHFQMSIKQTSKKEEEGMKSKEYIDVGEHRPLTMVSRSKSYYATSKKADVSAIKEDKSIINIINNTKIDKISSEIRNPFTLNQASAIMQVNNDHLKTARQTRFSHQQYRRKASLKIDSTIKLKSHEFSEKQKYMKIFKSCVDQIKSQIIKKSKNTSLNFFKEHGPKTFLQFKKIDYYALMQLLFTNQSILMEFYKMIFKSAEF